MRDKWSDERLDDLNRRVENGFNRVDADLRAFRSETKDEFATLRSQMDARFGQVDARFGQVDARFDRMDDRFDRIEGRFDALQRTMLQVGGGTIVALLGLLATQL